MGNQFVENWRLEESLFPLVSSVDPPKRHQYVVEVTLGTALHELTQNILSVAPQLNHCGDYFINELGVAPHHEDECGQEVFPQQCHSAFLLVQFKVVLDELESGVAD